MTKIHKTKLALLSATAFFTATAAHAQVADTWTINDDVIVSSANTAAVTLDPVNLGNGSPAISDPLIGGGFKNTISSSAVGASASSSFSSLNNSGVGGDATVVFNGGITVAAGNGAAVTQTNDVLTGAAVSGGSANSISLAAVGSSASVSGTTTVSDVGGAATADETFSYTAGSIVVSSGAADGAVETDQGTTVGGNDAAVSLLLDTSGFTAPSIAGGSNNSISVAGVGSSASASFTATVGGDGSELTSYDVTVADATISSANSALGEVKVGLSDGGMSTPLIEGGNGNAISAAAVGSAASFSLASGTFGGAIITEYNATVGELAVDSFNDGAVTLSTDGTDSAVKIDTASVVGLGNSISASAVGSSGSVSYANTVFDAGNGAAGGAVAFDAITVNSTNNGAIGNYAELTTSATIEEGSKNSISIAGVGASASQALSVTDYSALGVTGVATTTGAITLTAFNTGAVSVAGGMTSPVITDGFSNSISAAAVGASASQSVARTLVGAQ